MYAKTLTLQWMRLDGNWWFPKLLDSSLSFWIFSLHQDQLSCHLTCSRLSKLESVPSPTSEITSGNSLLLSTTLLKNLDKKSRSKTQLQNTGQWFAHAKLKWMKLPSNLEQDLILLQFLPVALRVHKLWLLLPQSD